MSMTVRRPSELGGRWHSDVVLKRDVFSTVERGHFRPMTARSMRCCAGSTRCRGGAAAGFRCSGASDAHSRSRAGSAWRRRCCSPGASALVRGWIDGVPLHIAKPHGDAGYFRSAKAALRTLHRAGISHNDLAKEQNWLYGGGRAYLTDFQLASRFRRDSALFRLARYEDLRHLLKHKRRYAPDALTAASAACSRARAFITRVWMATGKKVYYAITRGLERHRPRGRRPALRPRSAADRRASANASPGARRRNRALSRPAGRHRPLCLRRRQCHRSRTARLPRRQGARAPASRRRIAARRKAKSAAKSSTRRHEPVDLIAPLIKTDAERAMVGRIVSERRNLRDRFAF